MTRNCDVCQKPFDAARPNARFCGATCRKRSSRAPAEPAPDRAGEPPYENPLVAATRTELEKAGKVDTMLGQLALTLAERLKGEVTGVSALSKELRAVTAEACGRATAGSVPVADDVDELRARRDAKRVG